MITTIEHRTTSEDLLDLVPTENPNEGQPSIGQRELMNRLVIELRQLDPETARQADEYENRMDLAGAWTLGRDGNTSRWIDRLMTKLGELRQARTTVEIEDGMYLLAGTIYKVQHAVHGSGRQYAKMLVPPEQRGERAEFVYAPGAVRRLAPQHRMTVEQAREFGALYGTCVRCGRVLTREDSIERMMGEVCASKL